MKALIFTLETLAFLGMMFGIMSLSAILDALTR